MISENNPRDSPICSRWNTEITYRRLSRYAKSTVRSLRMKSEWCRNCAQSSLMTHLIERMRIDRTWLVSDTLVTIKLPRADGRYNNLSLIRERRKTKKKKHSRITQSDTRIKDVFKKLKISSRTKKFLNLKFCIISFFFTYFLVYSVNARSTLSIKVNKPYLYTCSG